MGKNSSGRCAGQSCFTWWKRGLGCGAAAGSLRWALVASLKPPVTAQGCSFVPLSQPEGLCDMSTDHSAALPGPTCGIFLPWWAPRPEGREPHVCSVCLACSLIPPYSNGSGWAPQSSGCPLLGRSSVCHLSHSLPRPGSLLSTNVLPREILP